MPLKVCWQSWSGELTEHLLLNFSRNAVSAVSTIRSDSDRFVVKYSIDCDNSWVTRQLYIEVEQMGLQKSFRLESNGEGVWTSGSQALTHLYGAIDPDLSATPFTNALPIRRLKLKQNQTRDIKVVYITIPELELSLRNQRYTCIMPHKRYLFEQPADNFKQEIITDENGLVLDYPMLFKRVKC
ncbi:MAG: putative glycolipid-binding domain-containing protein [Candidatus Bathyarchaeia archaeon]